MRDRPAGQRVHLFDRDASGLSPLPGAVIEQDRLHVELGQREERRQVDVIVGIRVGMIEVRAEDDGYPVLRPGGEGEGEDETGQGGQDGATSHDPAPDEVIGYRLRQALQARRSMPAVVRIW
jgi:hypothetical protein